ncbi:RlpA-like double-psi beta-barrel-protein domain-containing protein-containing protein [Irpex rosettiformis]|uniref:RlpA-like double-psi beta-barrel-protein domain-containing protein-containing protein n=1 Tax=Irpex rosettiformis TaxID=378272 RepID=A0ACB8UHC9_9APHY|nr:RlpA-like double-psi beta-barrel-protein domain-containing protein-containing protein [Irpex rosettiformis]
MLGLISVASLALSAVTAVNGIVLPHGTAAARHARIARDASTYDAAALEPYTDYNTRYWAIGCPSQHNTQFFDDCCHPLLKGETVERNRDAKCNPANLSSSATAVGSSAAPTASDDGEDCYTSDESSSAAPTTHSPTSSAAPVATSAAVPVNVGGEPPKASATTEVTTHTPTATPTTHTPTTSHTPTPTPTPTPAPASSGSNGFAGTGTWFTQNGVAGACGTVHSDNDFIVALDYRKYGDTGARSQYCGKTLTITNKSNGNTQTATVADACPTCGKDTDLDLSVGLFKAMSNDDLGLGVLNIEWYFN